MWLHSAAHSSAWQDERLKKRTAYLPRPLELPQASRRLNSRWLNHSFVSPVSTCSAVRFFHMLALLQLQANSLLGRLSLLWGDESSKALVKTTRWLPVALAFWHALFRQNFLSLLDHFSLKVIRLQRQDRKHVLQDGNGIIFVDCSAMGW